MARGGQRGYGNAGRSAYSGSTRGAQSRAVFASMGAGPTISYAAPIVAIGEAGGVVTSTITVVRNGVTGALVVNLSRTGTATSGSDYAPGPTSVTILAGQNSVGPFTSVTITDDASVEAAETIIETAQLAAYPLAVAVKTITIADNDTAGQLVATIANFLTGQSYDALWDVGATPDTDTATFLAAHALAFNASTGRITSTGVTA